MAGVPLNRFPARVINASFTLKTVPHAGCVPAMQNAVNEIPAHGTVIVVAAGHTSAPAWRTAGCRGVITVAATARLTAAAPYSNWGAAAVALYAPVARGPGTCGGASTWS